MLHTPARRNVLTSATALLTGLAAFASLAGTGYATGVISRAQARDGAAPSSPEPEATIPARASRPVVVHRRRPHRTVVRTEVVHRTASTTRVGTGGSISSSAGSTPYAAPAGGSVGSSSGGSGGSGGGSTSGGGGHGSAPAPAPAPQPAPAPKPAPAPSSGS